MQNRYLYPVWGQNLSEAWVISKAKSIYCGRRFEHVLHSFSLLLAFRIPWKWRLVSFKCKWGRNTKMSEVVKNCTSLDPKVPIRKEELSVFAGKLSGLLTKMIFLSALKECCFNGSVFPLSKIRIPLYSSKCTNALFSVVLFVPLNKTCVTCATRGFARQKDSFDVCHLECQRSAIFREWTR